MSNNTVRDQVYKIICDNNLTDRVSHAQDYLTELLESALGKAFCDYDKRMFDALQQVEKLLCDAQNVLEDVMCDIDMMQIDEQVARDALAANIASLY